MLDVFERHGAMRIRQKVRTIMRPDVGYALFIPGGTL
jgi:hypothetical protein